MTLETRDLRFSYNGRAVLSGLDLRLEQGESLGILGINGAGKSTLLRCLNRVLRPSGGTVLLEGRNISEMGGDEVARRLGYVPQNHPREPLSVFDAVLLGRRPHIKWRAVSRDLEVVSGVLERLGLSGLALRTLDRLSGGELQKVVIARALAQEPRILLLDEPTSNLDIRNQLEVMELVSRAVREEGLGAAMCLHDVNLALRYLDRLLFMKDGRVHALLSPEEVTPEVIREVYGIEARITLVDGQRVVIPGAACCHDHGHGHGGDHRHEN